MTLRQELRDARAQIAALQAQLATVQAALDVSEHDSLTKSQTITDLLAQIAVLEQRIAECEAQLPADPFQSVPAGADLRSVVREAGPDAKLQLPAALKLSATVNLLPGQYLRGPCAITPSGAVDIGLSCKGNDAQGAVLEGLDVSGFGLRGLVPWGGVTVKGGRYHDNGEMGIGFDGDGADLPTAVFVEVEADHNGDPAFLGHGASGVKLFHVKRSRFENLYTHDNTGNGLWFDAECGYADVIGGESFNNLRKGVFWEKCGGNHGAGVRASSGQPYDGLLTIDGLYAHDNNVDRSAGHGGVYVAAGKNVLLKNYRSARNGSAVAIRNDPTRVADDHPGWQVSGIELQDSTNDYGGERVVIGSDVQGVRRT